MYDGAFLLLCMHRIPWNPQLDYLARGLIQFSWIQIVIERWSNAVPGMKVYHVYFYSYAITYVGMGHFQSCSHGTSLAILGKGILLATWFWCYELWSNTNCTPRHINGILDSGRYIWGTLVPSFWWANILCSSLLLNVGLSIALKREHKHSLIQQREGEINPSTSNCFWIPLKHL